MSAVLEISEVSVEHRPRGRAPVRAVHEVSLTVGAGEIVGLVGESGCGKSSLARVAVGLSAPRSGRVTFAGRPVRPVGWHRRTAEDVGLQMVFQNTMGSLNPRRKIGDQLLDGIRGKMSTEDRRGRVRSLLGRVGMPAEVGGRYPHEFSGGQRQRLAIARALAPDPAVIVADEPVTALDSSSAAQVVNLLVGLVRESGMGMLFISHDLSLVRHIADRTAVMYLGTIVETAPTAQLWARPAHPYTRALIDAVPRISEPAMLPAVLAGEVPDPSNVPAGCPFRPRCPHAMDSCQDTPPVVPVGDGSAACWLPAQRIGGVN
jgi:oligopeptide/dipeptide ABC transporter ATP-binding protein